MLGENKLVDDDFIQLRKHMDKIAAKVKKPVEWICGKYKIETIFDIILFKIKEWERGPLILLKSKK